MEKMSFKKMLAYAIPAIIVIVGLIVFVSKGRKNEILQVSNTLERTKENPYYRSYPVMGTWAEVTLYGDRGKVVPAMDAVHNAFDKVNQVCSRFDSESELSKLNMSASVKPFHCSNLLWDILFKAKFFYELSEGSFDITITPLMKIWGFYRRQDKVPSEKEIKQCLKIVGLDKVIFDERNKTAYFSKKGMEVDLGGIAKGYAVDYAFKAIQKYGIESGVINLGGNIRFFPKSPPGKEFYSVGIRNPFDKSKLVDGTLKLVDKSLATSGDYEKYIIINNQRYTHIINPETGYPVKNMAAVTVVSNSALWCDALSTSVFIKGKTFAETINKKYPEIQMLIIKGYHDKPASVRIYKIGKIWSDISETILN